MTKIIRLLGMVVLALFVMNSVFAASHSSFSNGKSFQSKVDIADKAKGVPFQSISDIPDKANGRPFEIMRIQNGDITVFVQPKYIVVDDPALHEVAPGGSTDGVAKVYFGLGKNDKSFQWYGCSGALLQDGIHVLTAAHCITDEDGVNEFVKGVTYFHGDDSSYTYNVVDVAIHPEWDGYVLNGSDIAIITLDNEVAQEITRYAISDTVSVLNEPFEKIGFGVSGFGATGKDKATYPFGTKRSGLNIYDDYADVLFQTYLGTQPGNEFKSHSMLLYDFDDGTAQHDAFGVFLGINDLGLGTDEVNSASGDSGGPTIKNGVIIGITSFGLRVVAGTLSSDITQDLDSSFGEFSGDTNVAKYLDFIIDVTGLCYDTDGGINSTQKGSVTCGQTTSYTDSCALYDIDYTLYPSRIQHPVPVSNNVKTYMETCTGRYCKLREYYVDEQGDVTNTDVICENGCSQGSCVEEFDMDLFCEDLDNGYDLSLSGGTTVNEVSNLDKCWDRSLNSIVSSCSGDDCFVSESTCSQATSSVDGISINTVGTKHYSVPCPNGCFEGACQLEQ